MREDPIGFGTMTWERFVAIGDSSTEGLYDPDGKGGYRGWADRFAGRLAEVGARRGREVRYANLAIRGRRAQEIRAEQLPSALVLEPDLASVLAGMNDVLRRSFDAPAVSADVEAMLGAFRDAGATVVTFTLPDVTAFNPWAKPLRPRFRRLNAALRAAAHRTGSILVDLEAEPGATDPALWSEDRIHANAGGHELLALAVARAVGLPDADGDTGAEAPVDRPSAVTPTAILRELSWGVRYLLARVPARGRTDPSGGRRGPKRGALSPVIHG
jgi:lysophospholipase L1-like esterase